MRNSHTRFLAPAAMAAAIILAGAPAIAAQQVIPVSELPRVERDRIMLENQTRLMNSDRLYREGKTFLEQGQWKEAAYRFERAAAQRGDGDIETAKLYRKAADTYFLAGKHGRAVASFEHAARTAMGFGDIDLAAESYLKAALLSHERGDLVRANENGWKAHRLSGSAVLSEDIRTAIREHLIVGDAVVAMGG